MEYSIFGAELLGALSQPALLSDQGHITYMNPAAHALSGRALLFWQEGDPLPPQLPTEADATSLLTFGKERWQVRSRATSEGMVYLFTAVASTCLDTQQTFLYSASLRSRMTPLLLAIEQLQGELSETEFERNRQRISSMNRSYYRMLHIVDSLFTYSSLAAADPRQSGRTAQINLTELCDDMYLELNGLAAIAEKRMTLRLPENQEPLYVKGEQHLLERLIYQLCANALKAASHVTLSLRRQGQQVRLSVLDNGPGVSDDVLNHSSSLAPVYDGDFAGSLGFGLPICHQIARRHGGALFLFRREQGTDASVSLPLLPSSEIHQVEQPALSLDTGVSQSLLELSEVLPPLCYDPAALYG